MKFKIYFSNGLKATSIETESLEKLQGYLNNNQFVQFKDKLYNSDHISFVCNFKEKVEKKDKLWSPPK